MITAVLPEFLGAELGRGAHAVVYALRGGKIAVKVFRRQLQHELGLLECSLTHAHVVQVLGHNEEAGWLAMEYVDGSSLAAIIERQGKLSDKQVIFVLRDVVDGLTALHAHGCPHRDLKPSNVLQDRISGRCKLVDWIAQAAEDASLRQGKPVGTPVFMAPEVAGRPHKHSFASDSWALGCTVINLATGQLPWAEADAHGRTNEFMAMWRTAHGQAPPHDTSSWPKDLQLFVGRCFEPEPSKRAPARELRQDPLLSDKRR